MRHFHSVLRDMNEPPKTVRQGDFMNRVRLQDKNIGISSIALALLGAAGLLAGGIPAQAQTFNVLYNFQGAVPHDGAYPNGLVHGPNGYLYGTTGAGGQSDEGTVFRIGPGGGNYEVLWTFATHINAIDGDGTSAALVLATNGGFYGTTLGNSGGGSGNGSDGVAFFITPAGALTPVHNFCDVLENGICVGGLTTLAPMMQAWNGYLYGTTSRAGAFGQGTIFKMTPRGAVTTLYSFCGTLDQGTCVDGADQISGLVQGPNGELYGTATDGGTAAPGTVGDGTIFQISPSGKFSVLYNFCIQTNCTDGAQPQFGVIVGPDGNLYGTTSGGGATNFGTFFTITPAGHLTTLYSFCSLKYCPDGTDPQGIVLGSDGNFYGTTAGGGNNYGTIFQMTPAGVLTTLHTFDFTDGGGVGTTLMQDTSGAFYGTSFQGGNVASGPYGTLFRLGMHLAPFVETVPTAGLAGSAVKILGTNLTGATSVSFNGTPATFTVVSQSEITATVPAGATQGSVTVMAGATTLESNVQFTPLP
jgi:uncharacterized repeat protein (TIGR03803 family)